MGKVGVFLSVNQKRNKRVMRHNNFNISGLGSGALRDKELHLRFAI